MWKMQHKYVQQKAKTRQNLHWGLGHLNDKYVQR